MLTPNKLSEILDKLKVNLVRTLGDKLLLLTLYGSYARNEAIEDSDIDLLVVLKEPISEDETLVREIVYDTMWQMEFAAYLSLYLIDEYHYQTLKQHKALILKNIESDGLILWQAT